jgi:hypothetical protein
VDELGGKLTVSANTPTGLKVEVIAPIVIKKN